MILWSADAWQKDQRYGWSIRDADNFCTALCKSYQVEARLEQDVMGNLDVVGFFPNLGIGCACIYR